MKALIHNGQIVELVAAAFPVHESMQWIDAPADATMETHIFNGVSIVVKPPKSQAEIDAEESAAAKAALVVIDQKSVRSIREWILTQPNPPAFLVDYETQAAAQRLRIK